jgi:diacylglycerol O-acyltransferase / wax synthase
MSSHRMNNADAAWLHMDRPTNLMVVNSVLWFEAPVEFERAKEILRVRFVERFPKFRQRVVERGPGRAPQWEDDPHFDLDHHLHHIALPAPGDKAALEALVGDLMSTPLDRTKPLWDTYLVDGYGDGMAMISRIHHCVADGIALTRVLLSLTDTEPDAGIELALDGADGHRRLGAVTAPVRLGAKVAEAGIHEGFGIATHPVSELTTLARRSSTEARTLGKLLLTPTDADTVLRGELGVVRKVTWSDRMPLQGIKRIGHATGTTVNDVLVAAMTGALHRYLKDRDSLVDEIRAMVPFNLRPLDRPLPRELGNRFGLVYLSLPVGIADPATRLNEVHHRMEAIKHSPEGVLSYAILEAIGLTPRQVEQPLLDVFAQKTTAVLTNVPGPREPLYFAGSRLGGVVGWVPAAGTIGMGISIFSYDDGVTVGFQVDPGLIPDPETIITDYEREVAALRRLIRRRRTQPAAKPRTPARSTAKPSVTAGDGRAKEIRHDHSNT